MTRQIVLEGSREQIVAELYKMPGQVQRAIVYVEERSEESPSNGDDLKEWNRQWEEMIKLSPINEKPADISREGMYSGTVDDPR